MLDIPLRLVEQVFPSADFAISGEAWRSNLPALCNELGRIAQTLIDAVKPSLPNRVFSESKQELLGSHTAAIVVSEFRLRPQSGYYTKTSQLVPSPENPGGPHATGIEITFSLCRGYPAQHAIRHPWLAMEFSVWGVRERACFHEFFVDQRRFVEKLILLKKFQFSTACVFDNVDRVRGAGAFKQLDLYY